MNPWTVTSFWVSPDVQLKECSVRVERLQWPEDETDSGPSDVDEEEDMEMEEDEDDEEERNGEVEEWMILKAETSRPSPAADDATNSCLTRLLLKKCRHNSSSNESQHESQESGHKTTEKSLMLDAYHKRDIQHKTEPDASAESAQHEPVGTTFPSPSSKKSQPQQSFSNLLEQCLRRSKAKQASSNTDPESDTSSRRPLPCSLCTDTFPDINELCRHIRHHPPLTSSPPKLPLLGFRCPFCWEKFPLRSLLVGHMLYTCQTPFTNDPKEPELKGLVKATEVYYCEKCLQGFPSLPVATGHAKYTCQPRKPGQDYSDLTDEQVMIAHLFSSSPNVSKSRLLRVEEFRCPQCRLRFPTAAIAECHVRHTCVFDILHLLL
jgi:hypothetical protein